MFLFVEVKCLVVNFLMHEFMPNNTFNKYSAEQLNVHNSRGSFNYCFASTFCTLRAMNG